MKQNFEENKTSSEFEIKVNFKTIEDYEYSTDLHDDYSNIMSKIQERYFGKRIWSGEKPCFKAPFCRSEFAEFCFNTSKNLSVKFENRSSTNETRALAEELIKNDLLVTFADSMADKRFVDIIYRFIESRIPWFCVKI